MPCYKKPNRICDFKFIHVNGKEVRAWTTDKPNELLYQYKYSYNSQDVSMFIINEDNTYHIKHNTYDNAWNIDGELETFIKPIMQAYDNYQTDLILLGEDEDEL